MKKLNFRFILAISIVLLIFIIVIFVPGEKKGEKIKIGVSDDSSGMIIHYLMKTKGLSDVNLEKNFESYSIKDCCSSTAQWALSTELLDIAIMCPDAAKSLIEKDSRFEILGPCVLNSDIFVFRQDADASRIGVTQNREYQEKLVSENLGHDKTISCMLTPSLPYALEKGVVDGIVIDAVKGFLLKGNKLTTARDKDTATYVLVVSKKFKKDKKYGKFISSFKEAVNELNNEEVLAEEIYQYKGIKFSREEMKVWNQLKVKFVLIIQ